MMLNLLSAVEPTYVNVLDALIYAIIGLVVVFIGIALLVIIFSGFGAVMKSVTNKKPKTDKHAHVSVPQQAEAASEEEIPEAVKVAIVAAIMAYYETEKPRCEFTVKRIKRI